MIPPRCLTKDGDEPCDGFEDLHRRCHHFESEYAQAVRGWKQAVGIVAEQQKALELINDLLDRWAAEGRLPKGDENLARMHYEIFEKARKVGADYVKAMRQSGAIETD